MPRKLSGSPERLDYSPGCSSNRVDEISRHASAVPNAIDTVKHGVFAHSANKPGYVAETVSFGQVDALRTSALVRLFDLLHEARLLSCQTKIAEIA
jgi:hypothetical protein